MLHPILKKHAREFQRALVNHKWERTEAGGIYFPGSKITAQGLYTHNVNGLDEQYDPNLLPTESLNSMLDIYLGTSSKITAWYLGLYAGAVDPSAAWTAANVASNSTEITSGSTGYTQSTRVAYTQGASSGGSADNSAAKAAFTIAVASGQLTVNGAFLASASAKGATTGVLASATRFGSPRLLSDGDSFNLGYTVAATSS